MKRLRIAHLFYLIFLLIGVYGCDQASASLNPVAQELVSLGQPASEQELEPGQGAVPESLEDPEPDYCLDCHQDQQQLIDAAKPEEAVVVESSGEG